MKTASSETGFREIELKLALPLWSEADLLRAVSRLPLLSRRPASRCLLSNIYYDTPSQALHAQRVALRLRSIQDAKSQCWLQTLKTSAKDSRALSQRGEWEVPIPGPKLSRAGLDLGPWQDIDPDGTLFAQLAPCFVTQFERFTWQVKRRDRSVIEVALDLGKIEANDHQAPLRELELELKSGSAQSLFDLAQALGQGIALIPARLSKAQRGYRLLAQQYDAPQRAQTLSLPSDTSAPDMARRILRESWGQFTQNLISLRSCDDPELVHQSRVGWRRFKNALRFFRPLLSDDTPKVCESLRALLSQLGQLRDLDVARTQTLPAVQADFCGTSEARHSVWSSALKALCEAGMEKRREVRHMLETPTTGLVLLTFERWLEDPCKVDTAGTTATATAGTQWTRPRLKRLHRKLETGLRNAQSPEIQHRTRIVAKRLRYSLESLGLNTTGRKFLVWHQQAVQAQSEIGRARDAAVAAKLVQELAGAGELVECLRSRGQYAV